VQATRRCSRVYGLCLDSSHWSPGPSSRCETEVGGRPRLRGAAWPSAYAMSQAARYCARSMDPRSEARSGPASGRATRQDMKGGRGRHRARLKRYSGDGTIAGAAPRSARARSLAFRSRSADMPADVRDRPCGFCRPAQTALISAFLEEPRTSISTARSGVHDASHPSATAKRHLVRFGEFIPSASVGRRHAEKSRSETSARPRISLDANGRPAHRGEYDFEDLFGAEIIHVPWRDPERAARALLTCRTWAWLDVR